MVEPYIYTPPLFWFDVTTLQGHILKPVMSNAPNNVCGIKPTSLGTAENQQMNAFIAFATNGSI